MQVDKNIWCLRACDSDDIYSNGADLYVRNHLAKKTYKFMPAVEAHNLLTKLSNLVALGCNAKRLVSELDHMCKLANE